MFTLIRFSFCINPVYKPGYCTDFIFSAQYIRYYRPKELALADIFAGLTVGILHIPQALAFGSLTSVKFENGLFTSVWPVLIYVFFGTSAHVSMGTSAVICILTAATVDRLLYKEEILCIFTH